MTRTIDKVQVGATRLVTQSWTHVGSNPMSVTQPTWTNESHGVTNDQWQARIRLHDDVTSGFWARSVSVSKTDGYLCSKGWVNNTKTQANLREEGKTGAISHVSDLTFPSGDSGLTRARLMASANFWNEVQDALHALEGGELLGELRKTVKAVKSLGNGLLGALTDWKRTMRKLRNGNNRMSKRQLLGHAGDAYLQWKFGWDPLSKDIRALAQDLQNDFHTVVPVTGKGFGAGVPSVSTSSSGIVGVNYDIVTLVKSDTKVRYDAGLLVTRYGIGGFSERLGLSPSNFLPTLYNLLPWTYMIDYFTNLGSLVNALANMGCRFSYKSTTVVTQKETTVVTGVNPRTASGLGWIDAPGYPIMQPSVTTWLSKSVSRGAGGPDAWPELQFRMPSTETVGGRWQYGNIAAVLAAQTFGNSIIASYGPRG